MEQSLRKEELAVRKKERPRVANPTSTATATTAAADDTAGTEPVYANTPRTSSSTTTAAKPDVSGFVTKNYSKVSSEGTFETWIYIYILYLHIIIIIIIIIFIS